jgi:hypothetical protein
MGLVTPFWFNQRQGKAEEAGPDTYKLTGPNLRPALISIARADSGPWSASLRLADEPAPAAATQAEFPSPQEAWEAAFELFRTTVVV